MNGRRFLALYVRVYEAPDSVFRLRGFGPLALAGSEPANVHARSSHAVSRSSDAMPAGATSAHPLITRPFMLAGPVCGSARVAS